MKLRTIRRRMMLAVLLPVLLLASLLTAVFLTARMDDMGKAYLLKSQALVRQLAVSSEYGLFSANTLQLQALAQAALRETDVLSVVLLDNRGNAMASAGQRKSTHFPVLGHTSSVFFDAQGPIDMLVQPVFATPVGLDDFQGTAPAELDISQHVLGHVLVEFSKAGLLSRAQEILLLSLGVFALGLVLALFLALRLGHGVMHPISRVSQLIERIGKGEFSARNEVLPNDPLRDLQMTLNKTAQHLETSRDDLEQRITWATEALREKKEEAENATLSKSRFLAAASHDLRQPTHAMGMFVARLAQLVHDSETKGLIKGLESSVQAMQDLLDALLDVSRLEADAVPVQLSAFAIEDVFERLRGTFTLLAHEKGLSFHVRPSPIWVLSDSDLLSRVLMNLVSNALKYTQTGGVVVGCRLITGGGARLEVWDSGQGIAPEHHQAIFTEFFQVGNAERKRSRGLGLGLNIVQSILKLMNYSLSFRSRLGHGSRFFFALPVAPPGRALALAKQDEMALTQEFDACRVLLVEDDLQAMAGLECLLRSWGCTLRCAMGLPEALAQLAGGWTPDLIISDYHLTESVNGIDTIRQVRIKAGGSVAACLMSGDMNQDVSLAAKAALLTLLHKPVRPAKLRSLIRHLLKKDGLI